MNGSLRECLEARRRALAEVVAVRLLESPEADIEAELAAMRQIEAVLAALPPPRRSPVAPIAIGLASLVIVGLAWVTPISALGLRTAVALGAEVSALEMTLAQDWRWTGSAPLAPGRLDLDHAEAQFSDPGLAPIPADGSARLAVEAEDARLWTLAGAAGASLALETTSEGGLSVFLGGDAEAAVMFAGTGAIAAGARGRPFSVEVPELVSFRPGPDTRLPAMAVFRLIAPLELRDLHIEAISFGRLVSVQDGFVSSLRDGTLHLPQTGQSHTLISGEGVVFDRLEARVTLLRIGRPAAIEVQLQGSAARVETVQGGHARRATPSVLSYLYDNQRVAFFFASLSFMWATLWSVRRLLLQ